MKKFQRLICILMCCCFAITLSPCYAFDENATSSSSMSTDEFLLSRGFPADYLAELDDELKKHYASDESIFYCDSQTHFFNYDENGDLVPVDPDLITYGQIPSADLTLTGSYSRGVTNGNVTTVYYTFKYRWNNAPTERWQDPIGLTWNPNLLRLRNGTFRKIDKYTFNGSTTTHSNEPAAASYSESGVGWYADLYDATRATLFGNSSFELEPIPGTTIKYGTGWTSRMYGKYAHVFSDKSANFALTYGAGSAGISFGLPGHSDELGFMYDLTF